jgi:hypothetical protein
MRGSGASPKVKIDRHAPNTVVHLQGDHAASGWYAGAVTVTLDAHDPLSGVKATYYSLDGEEHEYLGPFQVSAPGITELQFWSVDNAGNVEAHPGPEGSNGRSNVRTIKIDGTVPTITGAAKTANGADYVTSSETPEPGPTRP